MKLPTQKLLSDKTFFIEFQGYLTNHLKHAIVALDKLEAPPERIQGYWDHYSNLTPYNLEIEKNPKSWDHVQPISDKKEWKHLRGKKEKWQEMCAFLEQEKEEHYNGDTTKLVQAYSPDLLGGIAGALTHGIIHLGWGIDAGNDWMTTEGLAYLNFCYLGVDESKFHDNAVEEQSPMESIMRVADDYHSQNLKEAWIAKSKLQYDTDFHPELVVAGFQWQLAKVLASPHSVATNLPTWLNTYASEDLWKELYRTCVWIYLGTRDTDNHGNFLVLHSLTSLWGLEKVCQVINDPEVERKALKQFYANLVCLLAASSGGFPTRSMLEQIQSEVPLSNTDEKESFDWEPIVAAGIQEEEEHNIKLVYVMKALWNRYGQWHGFSEAASTFTLTPNIGPSDAEFKA